MFDMTTSVLKTEYGILDGWRIELADPNLAVTNDSPNASKH
jgi:hypothetical protein